MRYKYNQFNNRKFESHMLVLSSISKGSKVLEIGCATGYFSKELVKRNCEVWGVEIDKKAAKIAKRYLKEIFIGDVDDIGESTFRKNFFDYILLQDVLEHIVYPEKVMRKIKPYLKNGGKIIISTPNFSHISILLSLFTGDFYYNDKGLMDKTHVHFFTEKSLKKMLQEEGFKITKIDYSADFGQIPFLGRYLRYLPKIFQYKITRTFNKFLAVQIILVLEI